MRKQKLKQSNKIPAGYMIPAARLHYFEPKEPDNFDGMPHKDVAFPIPCEWIVANASRFYFTNNQILEAAQPKFVDPDRDGHCRLWAVYFLIQDAEIVYVGQSSCMENRMEQHREDGKAFDHIAWFEAPQLYINEIEAFYIWRCNPIYNNKWPATGTFGQEAKKLDEKHGEKRNDAEYVIVVQATR
jgi:hypothetical protein